MGGPYGCYNINGIEGVRDTHPIVLNSDGD